MNEVESKRTSYYLISESDMALHSDPDDSQWLSKELALDSVRQLDAVLEVTGDVDALYLLSQIDALEAHLNEPHALFPDERDPQGIGVTEYPFD